MTPDNRPCYIGAPFSGAGLGKREDLKAGVHMKAVFWLGIMVQMQILFLRFKQSRTVLKIFW